MISRQFQQLGPKKPKPLGQPKSSSLRTSNFLPLPPSPEEKMLLAAKARNLDAKTRKINRSI